MGWVYAIALIVFVVWWIARKSHPTRPQHRSAEQFRARAIAMGRDPQRRATSEQRGCMWRRQRGLCAMCGWPMAGCRNDAHHIIPWCRGGRTVVSNMVLMHHEPCHAQVTRSQHMSRSI